MPGPIATPEQIDDLKRQVANLVRVGTVAGVDHGHTPPLVRVRLTEHATTDWRPYVELRAGATGTWNPPTVGECVLLLSPNGLTEGGIALPGLPTASHPAPSQDPKKTVTKYPDGAVFEYDHATHALKVTLPEGGTAEVTVPEAITVHCRTADVTARQSAAVHAQEITLDAALTTVTGMLTVMGLLTFMQGMQGSGSGPGGEGVRIDTDVEFVNGHGLKTDGGDIVAGTISLQHHRTSGVAPGSGTSDGPMP